MQKKWLLIFFIILLFSGCSGRNHELFYKNKSENHDVVETNIQKQYKIKPYDRLSIIFFNYPELSTKEKNYAQSDIGIEVRSDGTIMMPLIGKVVVAGVTKESLQDMLYNKYIDYLEDPTLLVEILNQKVYVLGEVKSPGALELIKYRDLTPLKAIVERGGLTNFAQRNVIKVVRGTKENYKIIHIDLTDMQSLKINNINLLPDDIVYVAHNGVKDFNLPLSGADASLSWINTLFSTITLYHAVK